MSDTYRVSLEAFQGPLDLLLHLIREEEVDMHDIPIARISDQYMDHLGQIERINVELAGEFLLMAATLMEIKSRMIALHGAEPGERASVESEGDDPRTSLVAQLLEYKKYRDAADRLEVRGERWSARAPVATASWSEPDAEIEMEDLHLNDLVDAFSRIISAVDFQRVGEHEVGDDDTPIELHAEDLIDLLGRAQGEQGLALEEVFEGRTRPQMIGLFIALLELVRQRRLRVSQSDGGIIIGLREDEGENT